MPRLRKQRRKQQFRYKVNRKRLRNKLTNTGKIKCLEVEQAWDPKKSIATNLGDMGLSYDPNKTIGIPNRKKQLMETISGNKTETTEPIVKRKAYIAEMLEADAKAPRKSKLRLPKSQVEWLSYLIKKYGKNYKAMARDPKNYYQETWKQLRNKIKVFKKIPEQYNKFLEENNLDGNESEATDLSSDGEI